MTDHTAPHFNSKPEKIADYMAREGEFRGRNPNALTKDNEGKNPDVRRGIEDIHDQQRIDDEYKL